MLRLWLAISLVLGACTNGSQTDATEEQLGAQAKVLEKAAETAVNEAVADFDVAEIAPVSASPANPEKRQSK